MSSVEGLERELAAELTRRHAILRAGLADAGGDALVATREGVVTYLTGYTTATWSNHSRPIIAVLTPGSLEIVCAETEADAVRSRVPGVIVHPYVELRPSAGFGGLPDGAIQFTPHAFEVLATLLKERGAPTDVPYRRSAAGKHQPVRRFRAHLGSANAQECLGD